MEDQQQVEVEVYRAVMMDGTVSMPAPHPTKPVEAAAVVVMF